MNLSIILSRLGLSASLTQDLTLLIVVVLASFLFGIFIGRSRLISVLLNIYISVALLGVIPKSYLLGYTNQLLAFAILVIGLTILEKRMFDLSISSSGSGMWRIFVMSFLEIMLVVSIVMAILPKKMALDYVSRTYYAYLIADPMRLVWMAAPVIFLFFIQKRIK